MNNLKRDGWILFSNNLRKFDESELNQWQLKEVTRQFCSKDFDGKWGSRCWIIKP